MTINKKSKTHKRRAATTHGYGSMKKHRGAGNRGGRGRAGSGKRGDANKDKYTKAGDRFGKHGFTSVRAVQSPEQRTINISDLQNKLQRLLNEGKAEKKGDAYVVDLEKLGYDKLLGGGKAKVKLTITTPYASAKAIQKIEGAGGSVDATDQDVLEDASEEAPEE